MAEIRAHRLADERQDLLEACAAVRAVTDREVNPQDPPAPVEELAGEVFERSSHEHRAGWVATVNGEPAGELLVALEQSEQNRHRIDVESLAVVPSRRRQGVADALLRACLADEEAGERTSITFWVPALPDGAGVAYAARCGGSVRLEERCSRLAVDDVPDDVVDGWIAEGRTRTDGYRLVQWVGPVPDEHLADLVVVRRSMQDMPVDDLDWTAPTMDAADLRSFEEAAAGRGHHPVVSMALSPDGDPAGFSALFLNQHRPTLAWQGDTGVLADHRGRGLGRWLKAENLRLAQATAPQLATVETYNAESNPWMLDINVAMGFRPHMAYQAWQAEVADVRSALGV